MYTYFSDDYVGRFVHNLLELFDYESIQWVLPYDVLECAFGSELQESYRELFPLAIFSWAL